MKKENHEKQWEKNRDRQSKTFDFECFQTARSLLSLQMRELNALQEDEEKELTPRALNQFAQALSHIQKAGRLALWGDQRQLDLFDQPVILTWPER